MYHFMLASNNNSALKIANDIVKPKYNINHGTIKHRMDRNDLEPNNRLR